MKVCECVSQRGYTWECLRGCARIYVCVCVCVKKRKACVYVSRWLTDKDRVCKDTRFSDFSALSCFIIFFFFFQFSCFRIWDPENNMWHRTRVYCEPHEIAVMRPYLAKTNGVQYKSAGIHKRFFLWCGPIFTLSTQHARMNMERDLRHDFQCSTEKSVITKLNSPTRHVLSHVILLMSYMEENFRWQIERTEIPEVAPLCYAVQIIKYWYEDRIVQGRIQ